MASGYRSLVRFDKTELDFGFELELDSGPLAPGESGTARMSFWAVGELPELTEGRRFELREGRRVIGHGRVTGMTDPSTQ